MPRLTVNRQLAWDDRTLTLIQLGRVPKTERVEFARKLAEDPSLRERVGERIPLLLDKANSLRKADMIGGVFRAFVLGRIELGMLERLAAAVDRIDDWHVVELHAFYSGGGNDTTAEGLQALVFAGLIRVKLARGTYGDSGGGYEGNEFGRQLDAILHDG